MSANAFATRADQPFRDDPDFARSVAASADALLGLLVATALALILGAFGAVAFAVPLALLVRAGVTGRRSAARSRAVIADVREWREAERRAVASTFWPAVIRARGGRRGPAM